ncbi:MAG TPA: lipid kinase [Xanthobacteraceae bacterium]|jgi:YegS/Rv2252/BmrU family lipid kinase
MTPRPALLVVNSHSRRGAGAAEEVARALQAAGVPVLARECHSVGELSDLIRAVRNEVTSVVIGGGDGTLNAAAPGLLDTGLPLGIIPLGTANDLARTLNIPSDLAVSARIIAAGKLHRIDLGEANGHLFFNVANIGFGVDLTRALTRDTKRRFGPLGYAVAGLRAVSRLRPFRAEIIHGSVTHVSRTVHVAVGNGRHYGGGMTVAEDACIDDGRLNVYSLEVDTFWRLLKLLPALRSGRHDIWEEIRALEGEAVVIRTPGRPRSVSADGEIVTRTPAYFRVRPGAVGMFVP